MRSSSTRKPGFIAGIILLVFSIIAVQFPLFNYLGYEFSVAIAFIIPWVVGFFTLGIFRRQFPLTESIKLPDFLASVRDVMKWGLSLLLIPVIVASLAAIAVRNCSYTEGLLYFLLIPAVTTIWSVGLAVLCFVMFRRPGIIYSLVLIFVLLYPLYLGYTSPQIFSYNVIFGFFPGFSYDEALSITSTLIVFRIFTLLMGILFLLISIFVVRNEMKDATDNADLDSLFQVDRYTLSILLSLAVLATLWINRNDLGFETSMAHVMQKLSSETTTKHFHIRFVPGSFSDEEIRWMAAMHEYRFHQVETALQVTFPGMITSYVFPDEDVKRQFIGTATTNIAKPWRKEIQLDRDSWQGTLRHELVHVIAGEFGMPIIKAHYHIGLVEGLAMAVDGEFGNRTLHEYAAAIKSYNFVRDPSELIKPIGFATKASSVSYVLMGSFCKYLLDRYGIVRFKELYHGKTEQRVYGKDYDELVDEWQAFLDRVPLGGMSHKHVEFFFRRPSIFAKECVRTIANRNSEASHLLDRRHAEQAMGEFSKALAVSWNTESYAGLVRAAFQATKFDTVIQLMNAQMRDSVMRFSLANLQLLYGDALWFKGHDSAARTTYEEIVALDLSDRLTESGEVRLAALFDETLCRSLGPYFAGTMNDSVAETFLERRYVETRHPLLLYIKAKFSLRLQRYASVIQALDSIRATFTMPALAAGKELMLAQAYFRLGQFENARPHFWQSLNFISNEASVLRVNDWLDRCDWFESNVPLR